MAYKYKINPYTGKLDRVIDETELSSGDMEKDTYDTDEDSIIDKAESLDDGEGNTATASDVKDAVDKKHEHSNKDALDDVSGVNTGDQDLSSKVDEAPLDGSSYNRKDGDWEEVDSYATVVTVGTSGADYDNFDDAIDYLRGLNGGVIFITSNMTISGETKDISNIQFIGDSFYSNNRELRKTSATGYWYGTNVTFENIRFNRMSDSGGTIIFKFLDNYQKLILRWFAVIGLSTMSPKCFDCNSKESHFDMEHSTVGLEPASYVATINQSGAVYHLRENSFIYETGTIDYVRKDSSGEIQGNPTVTSGVVLEDKCSEMSNDSSVSGDTVKDALETIDGDITTLESRAKVYTFNLPTTTIANTESIQIHRLTVPAEKEVKIWAAGLSSMAGTSVSGAKIQIYNEDDSQEEYSTNSTFVQGEPIDTLELAEKDISIKVLNDSGLAGDFNGFISITVE